ncbi:MAG: TRAP transporter permease [Desulfovibrionaceae bacterium]
MRTLSGISQQILYVYIVLVGIFHMYTACMGSFEAYLQRTIHLMLILPLTYLLYPVCKNAPHKSIPWYDWLLAALSMLPGLYGVLFYDDIVARIQQVDIPTTAQLVLGSLLVVMLLEGTRRVVGLPLALLAILFAAYMSFGNHMTGLLKGLSLPYHEIIEQLFLTDEGIFSMPLGVSATFVIVFLIFGGFLEKSGAGDYFMDIARALMGTKPGGPAQIAVLSSCLFGSISGSAVANVYGTGTFTIPMMKRIGYPAHFAGAVEAAASSGGQIMPPVMGAGAFLMASFLGIQYREVMIAAILPALLYYGALMLMVHLTAYRNNLRGLDAEDLPKIRDVLKQSYLLLPIVGVVYLLLDGASPMKAAMLGIGLSWLVSLPDPKRRMGPRKIIDAIYEGTKGIPLVCVACATAGIILGAVALTGIGGKLVGFVLSFAGNTPFLALLLIMLVSLVLGMGLPTTGAYILAAALGAPVLVKLGFPPLAAHMFVFYYAIISNITPPVALAAYAASSIAKSNPNRTGFAAMKLGCLAFLVPFAFCYDPGLLLLGDWSVNAWAILSGIATVFAFGACLVGYAYTPLNWPVRVLLAVSGTIVLVPDPPVIVVGCIITLAIWIYSRMHKRPTALSS